MRDERVLVRGGGDLGSGVALRLWRAGFQVVICETLHPVAVRRTVSFSEAVYESISMVEEATGRRMSDQDISFPMEHEDIPILVDPNLRCLNVLRPYAMVDAILAKRNTGTRLEMAPFVIGLGPGFCAGVDTHAVVETNRGPDLGRVIWHGEAQPNTGEPGVVSGKSTSRVLRAPKDGTLTVVRTIGDIVKEGETVATVSGESIRANFHALLRGLARDGLKVTQGMKVGDIDPRLDPTLCSRVSDKSLAIAGGVLEAIMMSLNGRTR